MNPDPRDLATEQSLRAMLAPTASAQRVWERLQHEEKAQTKANRMQWEEYLISLGGVALAAALFYAVVSLLHPGDFRLPEKTARTDAQQEQVAETDPLNDKRIEALVEKLADASFEVRETAVRELSTLLPRALPKLESLLAGELDSEQRQALQRILRPFRSWSTVWRRPAGEQRNGRAKGPIVTPQGLVVGLEVDEADARAWALLDPQTGAIRWKHVLRNGVSLERAAWSAEVPDRVIVTGTTRESPAPTGRLYGYLACLSLRDGAEIWSEVTAQPLWTNLAVSGSRLFFPDDKGRLTCRSLKDGHALWSRELGMCQIAAHDGMLLAAVRNGPLLALDANDGNELWKYEAPFLYGQPAFHDGLVMIMSGSGVFLDKVLAIRSGDGRMAWQASIHPTTAASLTAHDGRFFAATLHRPKEKHEAEAIGGQVVCFEAASGNEVWRRPFRHQILNEPAAFGGRLYVCAQQTFTVLDEKTGALVREEANLPRLTASPALAHGLVFLGMEASAATHEDRTILRASRVCDWNRVNEFPALWPVPEKKLAR